MLASIAEWIATNISCDGRYMATGASRKGYLRSPDLSSHPTQTLCSVADFSNAFVCIHTQEREIRGALCICRRAAHQVKPFEAAETTWKRAPDAKACRHNHHRGCPRDRIPGTDAVVYHSIGIRQFELPESRAYPFLARRWNQANTRCRLRTGWLPDGTGIHCERSSSSTAASNRRRSDQPDYRNDGRALTWVDTTAVRH